MSTDLEEQTVVVRRLRLADLGAVVQLDAKNTGRVRKEYFQVKLAQALAETGIQVSLAAEQNGAQRGGSRRESKRDRLSARRAAFLRARRSRHGDRAR